MLGRIEVLFVCTGNQCRSPMAEGLLRHLAAERGLDLTVSSTGLRARGVAASPPAVATLADRGIDLAEHRSRILAAEQIAAADLVVTMARHHSREVALLDRDALAKTFTLRELVRRAEAVGPRGHDEALADWLGRVGEGRRPRDLVGASDADDIPDPYGRRAAVYVRCAQELEALLRRLVSLVFPAASERPATTKQVS